VRRAEALALAAGLVGAALPSPAHALSLKHPAIASQVAVADGKVVFCQSTGLTVLELATGRVLLRDPKADCRGWLKTVPEGVLEMDHWRYRMIDPTASVSNGRITIAWEAGGYEKTCGYMRPLGDDVFLCPRPAQGTEPARLEKRSLHDGRLLWSIPTPLLSNDLIEREGRLLVQSGTYRRAEHLAIVDWATGRTLHETLVPVEGDFAVRSFDGTTVELESSRGLPPGCTARLVRKLRWSAGGRVRTSDGCGEVRTYVPPVVDPARAELDGLTLSFTGFDSGDERIDAAGTRGRWSALTRRHDDARRQQVYDAPGAVLLESASHANVWLECLDAATGRPRWMYAFPFHNSREWPPRTGAVRGTVLLDTAGPIERQRSAPYPAPVVLDPEPPPPPIEHPFFRRSSSHGRRGQPVARICRTMSVWSSPGSTPCENASSARKIRSVASRALISGGSDATRAANRSGPSSSPAGFVRSVMPSV
jgi:hypothetical protein